jgi:hypothetical protein
MTMRRSDSTFLRREVLPVLQRASALSPDAAGAAERLAQRLAEESAQLEPDQPGWSLNRWHRLHTETGDRAGWHVTLEVDGHEVPYLHGVYYDEGEHAGFVRLTLDRRFGLDTTVEGLGEWAWFLANAMAVSAGRTSHGENSYVRNPHGRPGGGDPAPVTGTLLCTRPGECSHCDPRCEVDHPHEGACMTLVQRPG